MNKNELINEVVIRTQMPYTAAEKAVNTVIDVICDKLAGGGTVKMPGFGTFHVKERQPRKCWNPHTRNMMDIPAYKAPAFRPGKSLKEAVKGE